VIYKGISVEIMSDVWASELQKGLQEYMFGLFDSLDLDWQSIVETLSGEPYCGCDVCEYREALFYVVPRVVEGLISGQLKIERHGTEHRFYSEQGGQGNERT